MTRTDVETFFQNLAFQTSAALATQQQLDRYLASGLNLLDLFGVAEKQLSYLLSRLLDPEGGHGQGTLFLELFLRQARGSQPERYGEVLGGVLSRLQQARIFAEHGIDQQRRIDLMLHFGDYGVGIENKPWAGDQPEQLLDYSRYLSRTYRDRYLLIYLSGDGRPPGEGSIGTAEREGLTRAGRLLTLGYRPFLADWAAEAAIRCEAEKVRWLLRDTVEWIERGFPQSQALEVSDER